MNMTFTPAYITVDNEECKLHAWHQGSQNQELLVLIAGGGGNGSRFNQSFPILSTKYHVCTFDRRGNSDSAVPKPKILNPVQQARDVVAIIKALGYSKAIIFGTSGGGIVAFQLAVSYPQHVSKLITHETPTMALLPDADEILDYVFETMAINRERGWKAASFHHSSMFQGLIDPPKSEEEVVNPNGQFFFDFEFQVLSTFTPNMARLRDLCQAGLKMAVTAGKESGDVCYARTTHVQAEFIGSQHHMWPGEHLIYEFDPEGFAHALIQSIKSL